MRQNHKKDHKSIRHAGGIGVNKATALVFAIAIIMSVTTALAQTQTQKHTDVQGAGTPTTMGDDALTPEQILALFQREAKAAYQMNKQACAALPDEQKKVCLARARLQFDADMRYAQKRADQGY